MPDILTAVNKEKFRRKLVIASRILAIFLILAIIFFDFIQIKYVKEINSYKAKYGSKWACYVCGLENGRSCSCNYLPDVAISNPDLFDKDAWFENIATGNIAPCENKNKKGLDINFSLE